MVAALNFRAKKGFGPFASIPTASQHVPFSAADGHQPMTAQRCQNRPSRWFTEAVGKRPKSNCLTIIKRPAGTDIPIQLLVRDRTPRQARQ
jgi:hypothetical protein